MRSSIDCTWLDWRARREPSLSVVITQLAPELPLSTRVPVTKDPERGAAGTDPLPVPVTDADAPSRLRRRANSSRDGWRAGKGPSGSLPFQLGSRAGILTLRPVAPLPIVAEPVGSGQR